MRYGLSTVCLLRSAAGYLAGPRSAGIIPAIASVAMLELLSRTAATKSAIDPMGETPATARSASLLIPAAGL